MADACIAEIINAAQRALWRAASLVRDAAAAAAADGLEDMQDSNGRTGADGGDPA